MLTAIETVLIKEPFNMRKLLIATLLLSSPCYAGLITHNDYTSGATITATGQNNNENTIYNEFNGNIDNSNIKPGAAIAVSKLATVTANSVATTDANGFLTASTATFQGYLTIAGSVTVQGDINFSSGNVMGIVGTNTDNVAGPGLVGQISSNTLSGAAVPTSNQYGDATSITLTPGDWEISAQLYWVASGATWSQFEIGISTTTGNNSSNLILGDNDLAAIWASSGSTPLSGSLTISGYRLGLSVTTTVYLKEKLIYSAATPTASGRISARRIR